jgi:hypothetical protein
MPNTPIAAHSSVVGGSSAGRVLACPGSIPLVQSVPAPPSSPYAEEGTALHEAMAHILLNDLRAYDVEGLRFNDHVISGEQVAECIVPCVMAFDEIVGNREVDVEVSAPFPGIPGAFGTADVVYYDDEDCLVGIIDWKFGGGVAVDATDNAQLKFYSCAAKAAARNRAPRLRGTIVQPRHDYAETVTFEPAQLDAFATELLMAVRGREGLHLGPHCRWCPAKAICPAQHSQLAELGQLSDIAADLPRLLHLADRAEEAITEIRRLALEALEHGQSVPGWKLVAKRATRHWAVGQRTLSRRLNKLVGRKLDLVKPQELISPAQAEKLIKPHKLPDGLTTSASSGNTMAPSTDPRPQVMSAVNLQRLASLQ